MKKKMAELKPENLTLIYFSPTSTTKIIMEEIARGMGQESPRVIDITKPGIRNQAVPEFENDIVLMGAPVYAGRLPGDAAEYFKGIKGSACLAVLVVLYGNREFEDALLELKNISLDGGFLPLAAGAFIGEHSFSDDVFSIASNRPDEYDLEKAFLFGKKIANLLDRVEKNEKITPLEVPGNFPYKDGMGNAAFPFITVTKECDDCGICLGVCPKNAIAIDESNTYSTIDEDCIFCCACVKACPQQARILKDSPMKEKAKWLSENCAQRKEPQTFLPEELKQHP
jgi:ferredoxin